MAILHTGGLALVRKGAPPLSFPDIKIGKNGRLILLGPSGSGKTTLLSILAGLLTPTSGQVLFDEQDMYSLPSARRDILRGRKLGFIFQGLHFLPALTLRQNIALASTMANIPLDKDRLEWLIGTLGLKEKADRKPHALSQGELQRAAVARSVLNRPALIIADEPTSALDDVNAMKVADLLITQAQENGAALLVATHDHRIASRFEGVLNLRPEIKEAA